MIFKINFPCFWPSETWLEAISALLFPGESIAGNIIRSCWANRNKHWNKQEQITTQIQQKWHGGSRTRMNRCTEQIAAFCTINDIVSIPPIKKKIEQEKL